MEYYKYYKEIIDANELNNGVGSGDPLEVSLRQTKLLLDLYPRDHPSPRRVCDFGCGIGRTIPPLRLFWPGAHFSGVDMSADFLKFCSQQHVLAGVDLYWVRKEVKHYKAFNSINYPPIATTFNRELNLECDFTYAYSILTHLNCDEAAEFLMDAMSTLVIGGLLLISCFILDSQSRVVINNNSAKGFTFTNNINQNEMWFEGVPKSPGAFTAFDLTKLDSLCADSNLMLRTMHRGSWRGFGGNSFHDMILLERQR